MYPIELAKTDNFKTTGFFYNPNIHPVPEYKKREKETRKYFKSKKLKLIIPQYNPGEFFSDIKRTGNPPARCVSCWEMRLERTASLAKEKGFDAFTTTLLASPYQDHGSLKVIAEGLADKEKVRFYYRDFREGFRDAHKKAREQGVYCQNYCGCIFSKIEREEKRTRKKRLAHSVQEHELHG